MRHNALELGLASLDARLQPDPIRVTEARARAARLIQELHVRDQAWMFSIEEPIAHGSHTRDTAIAGFKDIDYLLVSHS